MSRRVVAICLAIVAVAATVPQAASPRGSVVSVERWMMLDRVRDVGRIDWSCSSGRARIRFVNGGTTSRVRVFIGSAELRTKAKLLAARAAIEMPLGLRTQRWRVQLWSESLPPPVNFRIHPLRTACATPVVFHDRDMNSH